MAMVGLARVSPHRLAEVHRLKTDIAFLEVRLKQIEQKRRTLDRIITGLTNERNQTSAKLEQAKGTLAENLA